MKFPNDIFAIEFEFDIIVQTAIYVIQFFLFRFSSSMQQLRRN